MLGFPPFYLEYMNKGTPVNRAFNTLIGLNSVRQMNTPEAWVSGVPAFGGVASARGMAQFYQARTGKVLINGKEVPQIGDVL